MATCRGALSVLGTRNLTLGILAMFLVSFLLIGAWALGPRFQRQPDDLIDAPEDGDAQIVLVARSSKGGLDRVADAGISSWEPGRNLGSSRFLEIRTDGAKSALFRFDLSDLGAGVTLKRATLRLHVLGELQGWVQLSACAVARSWAEDHVTWGYASDGAPWDLPGAALIGADRAAETPISLEVEPGESQAMMDISAHVERWLLDPASNFGLLLTAVSQDAFEMRFASSEHGKPAYRPALEIVLAPSNSLPLDPTAAASPRSPASRPTATRGSALNRQDTVVTPSPPTHSLSSTPTPSALPSIPPVSLVNPEPVTSTSSVEIVSSDDTYLAAWAPDASFGDAMELALRSDGSKVALLRFNLDSIPNGLTVQDARLALHVIGGGDGEIVVAAYGIAREWDSRQCSWALARIGEPWAEPGCNGPIVDRSQNPAAQAPWSGATGLMELDVTALAQRWAKLPSMNLGVLIEASGAPGIRYSLASAEYWEDPLRPKLILSLKGR